MKKKIINYITIILCLLFISSCGTVNEEVAESSLVTSELITNETTVVTTTTAMLTETERTTTKNPYISISKGDKIEIPEITSGSIITAEGKYEVVVSDCRYTDIVSPSNPDGYYSYYQADDGKSYLVVTLLYKNLRSSIISCDATGNVQVKYDGNYSYNSFCIVEESDGSDIVKYDSISSLETKKLYYLVSVPNDVLDYQCEIILTISGDNYKLVME